MTDMQEIKDAAKRLAQAWSMNDGIVGFAEFLCWRGLDGKKATSVFYKTPEDVLDALLPSPDLEDWTPDSWAKEQYAYWRNGLYMMICVSDSRLDIIDWLYMKSEGRGAGDY